MYKINSERLQEQEDSANRKVQGSIESKNHPTPTQGNSRIVISGGTGDTSGTTTRALSETALNDIAREIRGGGMLNGYDIQYVNNYALTAQYDYDTYSFSFVIGSNGDFNTPLNSAYDLFMCGGERFEETLRVFFQYDNGLAIESIELGQLQRKIPLNVELPVESMTYPWILVICAESSSELISASQGVMAEDRTCKKFTDYLSQIHLVRRE